MDDDGRTRAQLIAELAAVRRQLSAGAAPSGPPGRPQAGVADAGSDQSNCLRRVERQLRDAVWAMRASDDVGRVLKVMEGGLRELGVAFRSCGINIVAAPTQAIVALSTGGHQDDEVRSAVYPGEGLIQRLWAGGSTVYRPDLGVSDPYGERARLERGYGHVVRSVVDVPFPHGTLAVNSDQPNAFTSDHLALLADMAGVLDEALGRRNDLQLLEQRHRDLQAEMAVRQQDLHRERVMAQIRDQILAAHDLPEVAAYLRDSWLEQLRSLGLPIYRVSLQLRSAREGYYACWRMDRSGARQMTDEYPVSAAPWVGEAWQTGKLVIVDRSRLQQHGFAATEVQSLIELPLPDGSGSLGASTTGSVGLDDAAVRTLRQFAGLLAIAVQR